MYKFIKLKDELSLKQLIVKKKIQKDVKSLLEEHQHYSQLKQLNKDSETQTEELFDGFLVWNKVLERLIGISDMKKDLSDENVSNFSDRLLEDLDLDPMTILSNANRNESEIGINALNICFSEKHNRLVWGSDFTKFTKTKEICVTRWNDAYKQILICMFLSKTFNCYFDLKHHLKILKTFSCLEKDILSKHQIDLKKMTEKQKMFFIDNLPRKLKIRRNDRNKNNFFSVGKYGNIKNFIKQLPEDNPNLIYKAFEAVNPKTRSALRTRYKKSTKFTDKLVLLNFSSYQSPEHVLKEFNDIYRRFDDKKNLISSVLKNSKHSDFLKIINAYGNVKKEIFRSRDLKKILIPGIFSELLDFANTNGAKRGPILMSQYKPIPPEKIIVSDDHIFSDYQVCQIKSVHELKQAGRYFQNCLRDHAGYARELIKKDNNIYFFTFIKLADNPEKFELVAPNNFTAKLQSFVCKISIKKGGLKIEEAFRKHNESTHLSEFWILKGFLISQGLIKIPSDYFAALFFSRLSSLATGGFKKGIKNIINDAGMIYAFVRKLRSSQFWMFQEENFFITEDIESKIVQELEIVSSQKNLKLIKNEKEFKDATI